MSHAPLFRGAIRSGLVFDDMTTKAPSSKGGSQFGSRIVNKGEPLKPKGVAEASKKRPTFSIAVGKGKENAVGSKGKRDWNVGYYLRPCYGFTQGSK